MFSFQMLINAMTQIHNPFLIGELRMDQLNRITKEFDDENVYLQVIFNVNVFLGFVNYLHVYNCVIVSCY